MLPCLGNSIECYHVWAIVSTVTMPEQQYQLLPCSDMLPRSDCFDNVYGCSNRSVQKM